MNPAWRTTCAGRVLCPPTGWLTDRQHGDSEFAGPLLEAGRSPAGWQGIGKARVTNAAAVMRSFGTSWWLISACVIRCISVTTNDAASDKERLTLNNPTGSKL